MRQRRPGEGGSIDFDAVIDKMSKPKELWEIRKSGDGTNQIFKSQRSTEKPGGSSIDRLSASMGHPINNDDALLGGGSVTSLGSRDSTYSSSGRPSAAAKAAAYTASRDNKEKEMTKTLHGHERPVTFITWNKDCNLLFTCGKDKIVCVYSFPEGEQLGVYHGHSGAVWSCSVTADSRWLVTSGADRLVIVWEARTSRELARVELPGVVRSCEWASTGQGDAEKPVERFVTCHNRFGAHPPALTVWRFDGERIEELLAITTLPTPANQVRWGRGDYLLASAHENGELVFWRADNGAEVKRLKAHSGNLSKFDFSSDREIVATSSVDKQVKVWDLGKGSEWKLLYETKTDRPLNAVALGPLTRPAVVGAPGKRPTSIAVIAAGGQDARDVAKSSSDSEQFGTLMFKLDSADPLPGELQANGVTKGHFGPVHTLAFARDGTAIASGAEDGCVRIHVLDPSKDGGTARSRADSEAAAAAKAKASAAPAAPAASVAEPEKEVAAVPAAATATDGVANGKEG
jgi:translation initiation factor 3 subunit I